MRDWREEICDKEAKEIKDTWRRLAAKLKQRKEKREEKKIRRGKRGKSRE